MKMFCMRKAFIYTPTYTRTYKYMSPQVFIFITPTGLTQQQQLTDDKITELLVFLNGLCLYYPLMANAIRSVCFTRNASKSHLSDSNADAMEKYFIYA